jgi:TetR/AcrR family transcriptional regulator
MDLSKCSATISRTPGTAAMLRPRRGTLGQIAHPHPVASPKPTSNHPGAGPRRAKSHGTARDEGAREQLLDGAIALFAARGYEGVSTGEVAKQAGLTQSMVHYYFGNKASLWEAAVERLMRRRGGQFEVDISDLRDLDPLSRLKVLIRRFVAANATDPHLNRILIHEAMTSSKRLEWLASRFMRPGYRLFNHAIQDCIDAGMIRPVNARDVTNIIVGASTMTFSLSLLISEVYRDDPPGITDAERVSDTLIDLLMQGLEMPPPVSPLSPSS